MSDDRESGGDGWESRVLCPDGACIGVIGANGLCSECGRPGPEPPLDPRLHHLGDEAAAAELVAQHRVANSTPEAPEDWDERALCPDGSCLGVIGPDGRCTVCGRESDLVSET